MTTPTRPLSDVPLPPGADFGDIWEGEGDHVHRVVMGANRGVTDSDVIVWTSALQFWDGGIWDVVCGDEFEPPTVHIDGSTSDLNSDQARELAGALIMAAAEADRWAKL